MKKTDYSNGLMDLFMKTGNITIMCERLHFLRTGKKTVLPPVKEFLHPELNPYLAANSQNDLGL